MSCYLSNMPPTIADDITQSYENDGFIRDFIDKILEDTPKKVRFEDRKSFCMDNQIHQKMNKNLNIDNNNLIINGASFYSMPSKIGDLKFIDLNTKSNVYNNYECTDTSDRILDDFNCNGYIVDYEIQQQKIYNDMQLKRLENNSPINVNYNILGQNSVAENVHIVKYIEDHKNCKNNLSLLSIHSDAIINQQNIQDIIKSRNVGSNNSTERQDFKDKKASYELDLYIASYWKQSIRLGKERKTVQLELSKYIPGISFSHKKPKSKTMQVQTHMTQIDKIIDQALFEYGMVLQLASIVDSFMLSMIQQPNEIFLKKLSSYDVVQDWMQAIKDVQHYKADISQILQNNSANYEDAHDFIEKLRLLCKYTRSGRAFLWHIQTVGNSAYKILNK